MSEYNNSNDVDTEQPKKNSQGLVASLLEYFEILDFSLTFVVLLFTFCVRLCQVSGVSMRKTLIDGEKLLVSNVFYEPECGDIIVLHQTGMYLNEPVVKRVIAVGGEKIQIDFDTWTVTVTDKQGNARVLKEDYAFFDPMREAMYNTHKSDYDFSEPMTIPEGYIFVMGDNRYNSLDSRFDDIGLVDQRRVLGKVIYRLTPFDKMGPVE
jgi:signal peptidase I